jgi:hypothetical protein
MEVLQTFVMSALPCGVNEPFLLVSGKFAECEGKATSVEASDLCGPGTRDFKPHVADPNLCNQVYLGTLRYVRE